MHYTSIENIHKVIDPLFLDALKGELEKIKEMAVGKTRKSKLEAFQHKLAGLTFGAAGNHEFHICSFLHQGAAHARHTTKKPIYIYQITINIDWLSIKLLPTYSIAFSTQIK